VGQFGRPNNWTLSERRKRRKEKSYVCVWLPFSSTVYFMHSLSLSLCLLVFAKENGKKEEKVAHCDRFDVVASTRMAASRQTGANTSPAASIMPIVSPPNLQPREDPSRRFLASSPPSLPASQFAKLARRLQWATNFGQSSRRVVAQKFRSWKFEAGSLEAERTPSSILAVPTSVANLSRPLFPFLTCPQEEERTRWHLHLESIRMTVCNLRPSNLAWLFIGQQAGLTPTNTNEWASTLGQP